MADVVADFVARLRARLERDGVHVELADIEAQVRREHGGRWVYVSQANYAERDAVIRNLVLGGADAGQVAQKFGLSKRQVLRIVRRRW